MNCFKDNYNYVLMRLNDQDTQQTINTTLTFSSESFKIIMATLLSIFVPQSCNDHLCTMEENFTNLIPYNKFVIAFNFTTLFYFIVLYYYELKREHWMIKHLEYDKTKNEYNLHNYKDTYPKIIGELEIYNKKYAGIYYYLTYIYVSNIIFSAILLFYYYYLDYRTATTFITNVILCWTKVMKGYSLSVQSRDENIAISYYNIKYISFNEIDPDHRIINETIDIGIENISKNKLENINNKDIENIDDIDHIDNLKDIENVSDITT